MHFSVVFGGSESSDISFGLVFIPSACWVRGGEMVVNLGQKREGAYYKAGDLQRLFDVEQDVFEHDEMKQAHRVVAVVVHEGGHGRKEDLELLESDLESAGFAVTQVFLSDGKSSS